MTTLLEKAKKHTYHRKVKWKSLEHIDLAVGWLEGIVSTTQVTKTVGIPDKSRGSVYCYIATAIKQGVQSGYIKIKKEGK